MPRPLALVNAEVWTLRKPGDRAEALLIEGPTVRAVGEERSILRKAHGAAVQDLQGKRVIPGLIDSHTHLVHQGLLSGRVDLWGARSKEEALSMVRSALVRHRGLGPLIAERWDESRWSRPEWPRLDELDALTQRAPVVVRRIDGHVAVGNTPAVRALEGRLAGVDPDTGVLLEEASLNLNRVWPTPVPESLRAVEAAQGLALRMGVTRVHEFVVPNYLRAYQRLSRRGRLRLRVHATPYVENLGDLEQAGLETGWGDDVLRLGGVKIFSDGSLGAHTAALRHPYADEPNHGGRLIWSPAALADLVRRAAAANLQPSIHAIGDAAIDQVLAAYRLLGRRSGRALRPRIEHFELHRPEHLEAARDLGVVASMQPNFVGEWSRKGGMYHRRLGAGRYLANNEFRRIQAAGIPLAFGSDCMPFSPWFGLDSVVHAPRDAQRLPLEAALRAYTLGSAYGLGREHETGSLEPGKLADLAVVQGNWRTNRGVARTGVTSTMVGGRWLASLQ